MTPPPARKPVSFGRYELLRRIGAGGMGEVFLARLSGPSGIAKVCVVKKMLPHLSCDRTFVERFLDEAKVVVHLAHGNIAQVFEMGEVDGDYFMAMEYVEGKTLGRLSARLRELGERFPLPLALYVAIRVCDALAYAHRKADPAGRPLHVVHRDVSPSNILISYDGEVKLIDFGAACSAIKEAHTAPRMVIGNLAYMSPEQARKKPVDGRADLYSVAVVLWELIAWSPMPSGGGNAERWKRAAFPQFSSPSKLQPDVPAEIDRIIMRGLNPERRDRHQNAEELRDDLQRALSQLASETSQSSLSDFIRSHFAQEKDEDRRMMAEALGADSVSAPDSAPADHEAVTAPTSLPETPAVRMLGDETTNSATTRPDRQARGDHASADAERPPPDEPPTVDLKPRHRPAPEHAAEPHAAVELTGQVTAAYRPPGALAHAAMKGLLFAAAFALGTLLALVAYHLTTDPPGEPPVAERSARP